MQRDSIAIDVEGYATRVTLNDYKMACEILKRHWMMPLQKINVDLQHVVLVEAIDFINSKYRILACF